MSIHEGKNISDTIGSIAKGAFNRGKAKKDVGISGISQVVQIIRENVREKTEKFSFFIVEEMEPCRRPEKGEQKPKGLLLPGISKFLYIYFNSKGSVRGQELSCKICSVRQICSKCDY